MKKLLTSVLALAMGATLVAGLAACADSEDQATADDIIGQIDLLYGAEPVDTPVSYDVLGQIKPADSDTVYAITWTVSSDYEGYESYVSVGEMDETSKYVTISIEYGDEVIPYKLNASVTVGKATASTSFNRRIPLESKVYTVAEAKDLGSKLDNNAYYSVNGLATKVYVKGYVTEIGDLDTGYNNFSAYIADTIGGTSTMQIFRFTPGSSTALKQYSDLHVGDFITVYGYLQNYNGKPQVTYRGSDGDNPICVAHNPASDAEKIAAAKADVDIPKLFTADYTLPATHKAGATFSWEATDDANGLVSITDGTLTISAMPSTPTEIELTVTISAGNATPDTQVFECQVATLASLGVENDGTEAKPFTPTEAAIVALTLAKGEYYKVDGTVTRVCVKGAVIDPGTWEDGFKNYNEIYIIDEDAYDEDLDNESEGAFYIYRVYPDADYLKGGEGTLKHGYVATFSGYLQNYDGSSQLSYYEKENVYCVGLETGLSDLEKAEMMLEEVVIPEVVVSSFDITLPVTGAYDVTYTYVSSNEDVIKIDATTGKMTIVQGENEEEVTITVSAHCGEDTATGDPVTVTVKANNIITNTVSLNLTTTATRTAQSSDEQKWQQNGITLTNTKTTGSTAVGDYAPIRIYQSSTVKIEYSNMIGIVFHCNSNATSYPKAIADSFMGVKDVIVTYDQAERVAQLIFVETRNLIEFTASAQIRLDSLEVLIFDEMDPEADNAKVQDIKGRFELTVTTYDGVDDITLPSTYEGAELIWHADTETDPSGEWHTVNNNVLSIKKLPTDSTNVELKLTVTIKVHTTQDDKEIEITLTKATDFGTTYAGTSADPFSVADVKTIVSQLTGTGNPYYKVNGANKVVYVKGYVTDLGTYSSSNTRFNNVYISDTQGGTDTLQVYTLSCVAGTAVTKQADLEVGDLIILRGYIQKYGSTPEITYDTTTNDPVTVVEKVALSAEEAATKALTNALAAINNSLTVKTAGDYALPVPEVDGVTIEWSGTDSTYTVKADKHTLDVQSLPSANVTITLTVKATHTSGANQSKNVSVTIEKLYVPGEPITIDMKVNDYALKSGDYAGRAGDVWTNSTKYTSMELDGNITVEVTGGSNTGRFYTADPGTWRIYQNENPTITFTAPEGYTIETIVITYANSNNGVLASADKSTQYTSPATLTVNARTISYTVANTGTATNGNIQISAIKVIYKEVV